MSPKFDDTPSDLQMRFDCFCRTVIKRRVLKQVKNYITYCKHYPGFSLEDAVSGQLSTKDDFADIKNKLSIEDEIFDVEDDSLADAIESLREKIRDIFLMHVLLERSLSEIADELELTYQTVRVYSSAALKDLRKKVDNGQK